ncbi:MAG: murein biosynthesis integral membrane protein MurJ [Corynebacterium sp.]|uniref:murein biosynthesis integral membrane protein MurJ n=1 Tax=Corynebacterium sp. TaxID=1720 RepID=UPI0026DB7290|nr:murein biosynthesis integral membrane protein MurJ [Corynebacterium sp.]MDO4761701.1 murein biosynthesis integral membrane protein MurJ [Corynebacterium sp.]
MSDHDQQPGLRGRIIEPAPPAPVPKVRKATTRRRNPQDRSALKSAPQPAADTTTTVATLTPGEEPHTAAHSAREGEQVTASTSTSADSPRSTDEDVVRSSGSMAVATLCSRITGFLRNVFITATLGGAIASAFNTANTLPNLVIEIVLGAVLTSLVVPVLVRAEKEDPDRGEAFIRRLFTLAATLLGSVTIIAVIATPLLVTANLGSEGKVNLTQATGFAYWLLPQIFFYGMFSLLMAILNTKGIFKPGAWAPVINNIIVLIVMAAYWLVPGELTPSEDAGIFDPHIMLLGVGTTLGVIVQALIMVPYIKKAGVSLKPLWGIDERLKQFGGMAAAIIVYVAISQLGYIVTTRIASAADAAAPNIYQQAWLLLQVPYGIIGVTLLTAIMPRLSRNAADGDDKAVTRDLVMGSKLTFIALIPIVVFFTIFGTWIARGLFAYGQFDGPEATILGWTLSFSAFTLLPYAMVLLHLRVFYAREEAWTPTFIIAGITATKVALSILAPIFATSPSRVVILLGAANGFGFVAGAVIGAFLLRRKLGNLGTKDVARTCVWALGASAVGGAVAFGAGLGLDMIAGSLFDALGSVGYLVQLAITGTLFLIVTGLVISRSGLREVIKLGQMLRRIPGMSRIIKEADDVELPTIKGEDLRIEATYIDDTFNATPVPPPMSAGIVRGPRLVPGAEVSDGSFRLLVDHGSVPGARFWRAIEKSSGREVALTFVDTSGQAPMAPLSPAEAQAAADRVKVRTLALAGIGGEAIAKNIEVRAYRNGCLIIADWVHGSPLAKVAADAEGEINPYAAAHALAPLVAASEHKTLGLDNRARIRINTAGVAVLAFPAVLDDASHERDLRSLRTALSALIDAATAPSDIQQLLTCELEQIPAAFRAQQAPQDNNGVADTELELSRDTTVRPEEPALKVVAQAAPQRVEEPVGGFGRKGYSRAATTVVFIAATALVIAAAVITAYLTSLFNSGKEQAPIKPQTITHESSSVLMPDVILTPSMSTGWREESLSAAFATDRDSTTVWHADAGHGVLMNLDAPHELNRVALSTTTPGFKVRIFGVQEAKTITNSTSLNELLAQSILAEKQVDTTLTTIDIESRTKVTQVLVYIEQVAPKKNTEETHTTGVDISEITLVGQP